jgi:UDP-N-acetylglucosamine 1-carboxyvinyltransferase
MSAAFMTGKPVTLHNIPDVIDVHNMSKLMTDLGAEIVFKDHVWRVHAPKLRTSVIDARLAEKLRASIMLAVPVFVRTGSVVFPHPGGCVIGERPIDIFLDGYQAFGATVAHSQREYTVYAKNLHATDYTFPIVSVQVPGVSKLTNAACEPDIETLANFLNACGTHITGAGTPYITIEGTPNLEFDEIEFTNAPDRIEAGSLIILGIAANAELEITDLNAHHLNVPLAYLKKMGAQFEVTANTVKTLFRNSLMPVMIKTHEYPGFPTDLQSPMVVLMTQAEGQSIMHETIFEGRMAWVEDLKRMGANILNLDNFRVAVTGATPLRGRTADSLDIRAGMAYLIAGLIARGVSTITDVEKIDRGYERIEERLRGIGADIMRGN